MIRKIYIARHAEALYGNANDHSRPLSPKGIQDCKKLAKTFDKFYELPKLIIASDAVRTLETANYFKNEINADININIAKSLYNTNEEALFKIISLIPNDIYSVMIIGHNPTIEKFCFKLISQNHIDSSIPISVTPATIIAFEVNIDQWENIKRDNFKYQGFLQP